MDKVQSCGCGKKYVSTVTTFAETIFRECIFAAIGEILKTQLQTRAHRCSFVPTHLLHFGISQMKESQSTDNMLKTLTLLIWPWWVRLPMKMMKMMTTQVLPIMILSALHYIADTHWWAFLAVLSQSVTVLLLLTCLSVIWVVIWSSPKSKYIYRYRIVTKIAMGELAHIGFAIRWFKAFLQDWSSGLSSGVVEARTGRSSGGYLCQPTLPPLVPAAGKGPPVPSTPVPPKPLTCSAKQLHPGKAPVIGKEQSERERCVCNRGGEVGISEVMALWVIGDRCDFEFRVCGLLDSATRSRWDNGKGLKKPDNVKLTYFYHHCRRH